MEIFACSSLKEISTLEKPHFALLSLKEFGQKPSAISLENFLEFASENPDLAKRVYIEALAPLAQSQIANAGLFLDELKDLTAGFYFSDDGFLQLAKEKGMENQVVFFSETLLTNALDVRFYLNQKVQAVSLSPLLSFKQIQSLLERLSKEERGKVEVIIKGRKLLMESRRPFLSNYFEAAGIENRQAENQPYFMKEKSRDYPFEIIETKRGSLIYEKEPFDLGKEKEKLEQLGIKRFRQDFRKEGEMDG